MKKGTVFVYRKGALGDTIAFIPYLFALRKYYQNIIFAGNYLYRELFEELNFIKFLDADCHEVLRLLKGEISFPSDDYLIFSRNSFHVKASNIAFYEPLPEKSWFYLHPFEVTGIPFTRDGVYLPIGYDEEVANFIGKSPFLVFHPGSGGKAKRWDLKNFFTVEAFVKERFNIDVIYLLGEAELELKDRLLNKKCLVNWPLKRVIFLLSNAFGYLGCDSGISHLAGILNLKGVVVFGPSSPELFRPMGNLRVLRGVKNDMESVAVNKVIEILEEELEEGRNLPCF